MQTINSFLTGLFTGLVRPWKNWNNLYVKLYPFLQWHFQISLSALQEAPFLQGFAKHPNEEHSAIPAPSSASFWIWMGFPEIYAIVSLASA